MNLFIDNRLLYQQTYRKEIFLFLFRKIHKEILKFKKFDFFIFDFLKFQIRKKFILHKNINNLNIIEQKLKYSQRILEDLKKINFDKNNINNNEISSVFNYIVRIKNKIFIT